MNIYISLDQCFLEFFQSSKPENSLLALENIAFHIQLIIYCTQHSLEFLSP